MFHWPLALAALACSAAAGAAAPEPAMPPTSKWVVNFADAQCVATRNYGTEADPLYLVLKAPAIGDTIQLGFVRKGARLDANQVNGELIFDEASPLKASFLEFGVKSMGQRARFVNLAARDVPALRQAKTIRVRIREKGIERLGTRFGMGQASGEEAFAVTQMSALLATLGTCAADLRRIWRAWDDEKGGEGLKQGPSANLSQLFSGDDYPGVAALKGQQGRVSMVILVDEQGKVADCTVIDTSGVASLDAQSCSVIKLGAKYQPAIGLDGKPAKSAVFQRISWKMF
ncbi:MAG: energy transducer TonB [Sphingomonas sp.]|nr:energy transducer TonB [Sphingomonas sp.]